MIPAKQHGKNQLVRESLGISMGLLDLLKNQVLVSVGWTLDAVKDFRSRYSQEFGSQREGRLKCCHSSYEKALIPLVEVLNGVDGHSCQSPVWMSAKRTDLRTNRQHQWELQLSGLRVGLLPNSNAVADGLKDTASTKRPHRCAVRGSDYNGRPMAQSSSANQKLAKPDIFIIFQVEGGGMSHLFEGAPQPTCHPETENLIEIEID